MPDAWQVLVRSFVIYCCNLTLQIGWVRLVGIRLLMQQGSTPAKLRLILQQRKGSRCPAGLPDAQCIHSCSFTDPPPIPFILITFAGHDASHCSLYSESPPAILPPHFLPPHLLSFTSIGKQTNFFMSDQLQEELEALLNGPAGTPPVGTQPTFSNPPNLDTISYLTTAMALALTTLAVFIRIYTRRVLLHSLGYDDCECLHPYVSLLL